MSIFKKKKTVIGGNIEDPEKLVLAKDLYVSGKARGKFSGNNRNNFVIGQEGTGKTNYFLLPNLLEINNSFFVIDREKNLLKQTEESLRKRGYSIVSVNERDLSEGDFYNPFEYITNQQEIYTLATIFINNVFTDTYKKLDFNSYHIKRLTELMSILMTAVNNYSDTKHFHYVIKLLNMMLDKEDCDECTRAIYKNLFDDPYLNYRQKYFIRYPKEENMKTMATLKIKLEEVMPTVYKNERRIDELNLESIYKEKKAIFVHPDMHKNQYNWITSFLTYQAVALAGKTLENHIQFFLDDISCLGSISQLQSIISVPNKVASFSFLAQSVGQMKKVFGINYEPIIGICDNIIIFGSIDYDSKKFFDKHNVDLQNGQSFSTKDPESYIYIR